MIKDKVVKGKEIEVWMDISMTEEIRESFNLTPKDFSSWLRVEGHDDMELTTEMWELLIGEFDKGYISYDSYIETPVYEGRVPDKEYIDTKNYIFKQMFNIMENEYDFEEEE
jgi:hypothetical protein